VLTWPRRQALGRSLAAAGICLGFGGWYVSMAKYRGVGVFFLVLGCLLLFVFVVVWYRVHRARKRMCQGDQPL
jgi:uncharacterized membrane protein